MNFSEIYRQTLFSCGLEEFASEKFSAQFECLTALLLEANAHLNLTAITAPEEIVLKHYADCLKIAHLLPKGAKMLDVGCGAGFPTLPVAIARPDLRIFSLDGTAKKLNFVERCAKELSLNVKILPGRAEELSTNPVYREQFDAVTARAVAELRVLCEWCLPFVKVGGVLVAMKGANGQEELATASKSLSCLGGQTKQCEEFSLSGAKRFNIVFRKTAPTPKNFPRRNSVILKNPL